jgi:hypothetical protein
MDNFNLAKAAAVVVVWSYKISMALSRVAQDSSASGKSAQVARVGDREMGSNSGTNLNAAPAHVSPPDAAIAQENPEARSEARSGPNSKPGSRTRLWNGDTYVPIVRAVVEGKPVAQDELARFLDAVRMNFEGAIRGLRTSFEEQVLPQAMAEMLDENQASMADSYEALAKAMAQGQLSRAQFDALADKLFVQSLETLGAAIRAKQVTALAPVIFYSPEMKARLIRYIQTVQQGFEAAGDITAENYRITLVSENKAALIKLKTELSKAGMLRGVQFIGNKGPEGIVTELGRSVFENKQFKGRFGVFFPDEAFAQKIPEWQRVVRSEIPKEYGILFLPVLSCYFAQTATSDINATTLRHALPDLFASAAFRVGQGIAIVAAFLEHIAAAERQFSTSA